ncbi:unnamed protein product [Paramecium sonneborni]|uniref:Protein kinase domain-containing protein n=1 Tax=Paramecium sonneborni TaxID=65129 RepID=A0A8S1RPW8_9CILI|nr:unnamed protein product [Paramecium sonneborni]
MDQENKQQQLSFRKIIKNHKVIQQKLYFILYCYYGNYLSHQFYPKELNYLRLIKHLRQHCIQQILIFQIHHKKLFALIVAILLLKLLILNLIQTVNNTYIITEYYTGGYFRKFIKVGKKSQIFQGLFQGIQTLIKYGIISHDITLANILIHDSQFKITCFEIAQEKDQNLDIIMNSLLNTSFYDPLNSQKSQTFIKMWYLVIKFNTIFKFIILHPSVTSSTKQLIKVCLQKKGRKRWNFEDKLKMLIVILMKIRRIMLQRKIFIRKIIEKINLLRAINQNSLSN